MLANGHPQRPIPNLADYDVSPITGFAPHPQPCSRLTLGYYEPWESIMDHLNSLMNTTQLRTRVNVMPLLEVDRLTTLRERQRAYTLLGILTNCYVWSEGYNVAQSIPETLAIPFQAISDLLDIPPVLTFAANNLWNWKLIDENGPYTLENITALHRMTDTSDEDWFVIVPNMVEMEGGAALQPLLEAIEAVRVDDIETVIGRLQTALTSLEKVGKTLGRLFEKCDPATFYWKIRPFLNGYENMAEFGLPNGLEFKGVNNNERKHFMGATGGQTSTFPALDLFFGVQHHERSGSANAMLLKMKQFMPAPHRAFLDHLASVANLRPYVLAKKAGPPSPKTAELTAAFDACLQQMKVFRDLHIQVVTRYILTQARRGPPEGWPDYRIKAQVNGNGSAATKETAEESPAKGTGGSELMPFLKTLRVETVAAKTEPTA